MTAIRIIDPPQFGTIQATICSVPKGSSKPNGKIAKKDVWRIEFSDGTHSKWMNGKYVVRIGRKIDKLQQKHFQKVTDAKNEVQEPEEETKS